MRLVADLPSQGCKPCQRPAYTIQFVATQSVYMSVFAIICASMYTKVDIVGSAAIPEVHRQHNQVAGLSAISPTCRLSEQQYSGLTVMSFYSPRNNQCTQSSAVASLCCFMFRLIALAAPFLSLHLSVQKHCNAILSQHPCMLQGLSLKHVSLREHNLESKNEQHHCE